MTTHKRPLCYGRPRRSSIPPPVIKSYEGSGRINEILSRVNRVPKNTRDEWRPVYDFDGYIHSLRINNHPKDRIDAIIARHEEYYRDNPPSNDTPPQKVSIRFPYDTIEHVKVETIVNSDGHVSVNMSCPFENFYSEKDPKKIIAMYEKSGFSEEQLCVLRNKFTLAENKWVIASKHLEEVMSRYSGKSSTRAKRKTLRSRFTTKKSAVIKAMEQEYSTVPDPEEDDNGSGDEGEQIDVDDGDGDKDDDDDDTSEGL
jgi:hypothetical protein